jgi:lipid-A-disaccharide synthase-like uncharacterized protein
LTNSIFSFSLLPEMIASETSGFLQHLTGLHSGWFYRDSHWWTAFGLLGAFLFGSRFIVQWLHSERHKRVIVPPLFWHLSFWGSIVQLIYGFHLDKLPVILGYLFLPFLYARNLRLLRRNHEPPSSKQGETGQTSQPSAPPNAG